MITYDYECIECNFRFTYLGKNWKEKPKKCPKCNTKSPKRLISRFHTKSFYGPWEARHRRGLKFGKPNPCYPIYSKEDLT